jgi:outer membrane immunogenic protein
MLSRRYEPAGAQDVDWYGTLRARLGVLAANHVMLYATGGLAYGRIREAASFSADVEGGGSAGGFSIQCPVANIPYAVGRFASRGESPRPRLPSF